MKDTGLITAADLVLDPIGGLYTFARLTFPSPTGILRFTDYPAAAYTGNIDGSSQTWDGSRGCRVPELAYQKAAPLSNATIELGNADAYFSDLHNTHGTLRGMPAMVWRAQFIVNDPATTRASGSILGAIKDKVLVFAGETDRSDVGDLISFALAPADEWKLIPGRRVDTRNFPFLSKPNISFKWGSVQVTVPAAPSAARPGYGATPQPPYVPRDPVATVDPGTRDPGVVGFR